MNAIFVGYAVESMKKQDVAGVSAISRQAVK